MVFPANPRLAVMDGLFQMPTLESHITKKLISDTVTGVSQCFPVTVGQRSSRFWGKAATYPSSTGPQARRLEKMQESKFRKSCSPSHNMEVDETTSLVLRFSS